MEGFMPYEKSGSWRRPWSEIRTDGWERYLHRNRHRFHLEEVMLGQYWPRYHI